ncbi:MAG TPA: DUF3526 domain-containing protein, partial [Myxococcales bacterium]|nr:DUF3526 domain-containing protein [Myxococcales bacterium]
CARAIALCTVTLVFALLGLFVAGAELGQAGAWSQVGFYALVLVAWALFWLSASIAVNAWGPNSARNALFLVGMWLVLVVVVPGLVHVAVDSLYPPPSRIEMLHEAREAAQKVEGELNALVGRHDVDLQSKGYAKRVVEVQEELARRSSPVLGELREKLKKRQEMLGTFRFLSPAIVVQLALEDVAGSGSVRHQRFEEQVDAYHKSFRAFFFERIRSGEAFNTASLESLPQFSFVEESSGALMWRVLSGVLGLLLFTFVLILIALPGLKRVGRLAR